MKNKNIQRLPAEFRYASELQLLSDWDDHPVPPGWLLSPLAVEKFILGDEALGVSRKLILPQEQLTRLIISLATDRGGMLVGQPGTAKSLLSELVATAMCGSSSLMVQGGSIESMDQLLYSWHKNILQEKGFCREALVPGPVYQAMQQGKILRFEELARCPQPLQDALISILSERVIRIPELNDDEGLLYASYGFNIIGTANSLDVGLNNMSVALKRRFSFETISPIQDLADEVTVVARESEMLLKASGVGCSLPAEVLEVLVTIFHELRNGQSVDGRSCDRLEDAVMSTAEAISVAHALGVYAHYYTDSVAAVEQVVDFVVGAAVKDNDEDLRRAKHYFSTTVGVKPGAQWQRVIERAERL